MRRYVSGLSIVALAVGFSQMAMAEGNQIGSAAAGQFHQAGYLLAQNTAAQATPQSDTSSGSSTAKPIQDTAPVLKNGPATYLSAEDPNTVMASKLIGAKVYAVNQDIDPNKTYPMAARSKWESIGSVSDVILNWNGQVQAVEIGVGGFLGIGKKEVAIDMASLKRVRDSADSSDWFIVVNTTKEALNSAPAYVVKTNP